MKFTYPTDDSLQMMELGGHASFEADHTCIASCVRYNGHMAFHHRTAA